MAEGSYKSIHNDFVTQPVPAEQLRPWWEIALVTSGFCMAVSGMFAGAALTAGLSLNKVVISILIGNSILAVCGGLTGAIAAKTHVSTTMLSRYSFGRYGSIIVSMVWTVTLIGWFSVQAGFFGQTVHSMFSNVGFLTKIPIAATWGGILMILTAYIGFKGIRILSVIAIPLLILLSLYGIIAGLHHAGGFTHLIIITNPTNTISLLQGIGLVIGTFALGVVIQPDISRYAKTPQQSWVAILIGMLIANSFIIFAGAMIAMSSGTQDLTTAMIQLGLGIPALLILITAQWTSNDSNLYSASLALSNIFHISKNKLVLVVGIIATIIGAAGMANHFVTFLIAVGIAIPPIAGVMIADYFLIHKKKYYFGKGTKYVAVVWPAFIAWTLGILTGVNLKWGIPAVNSLLVALVAHWGFYLLAKNIKLTLTSGIVEERTDGF